LSSCHINGNNTATIGARQFLLQSRANCAMHRSVLLRQASKFLFPEASQPIGARQVRDEIVASHQVPGDLHRPKSPHHNSSIDELLGRYRPSQNSILECIASLDDSSFISTYQDHNYLIVRESALTSAEKMGASCSTCEAVPLSQLEPDKQKRKSTDEPSDLDRVNACRCTNSTRRRKKSMSMEEKEDRRRDQNREAQRRYREKNMLSSPSNIPGTPLNQWGRGTISFIGQW
jgi:hypothetical protein